MPGTAFRPSSDGCTFSNASLIGRPITLGRLRVGVVSEGLCGGMVLVALRDWRAGRGRPRSDARTIARVLAAQVRSLDIPRAPWRYLRLQWPTAVQHRRTTTLDRTLPRLRDRLASGDPVPLALICALGRTPMTAVAHHIVLAYAIRGDLADSIHAEEIRPDEIHVAIYDPNYPDADDITLSMGPGGCRHSRGRPVHAVFELAAR